MRFLLAGVACALFSSAAVGQGFPALPLSAVVKADVQCFTLYAAGVDMATDEKERTSASLGLMYFFAKLHVEAPELDLFEAIRQEAEAIAVNPRAKEIGAACDAEVQERGKELMDLGQKLESIGRQSSSSSSSS